VRAAPDAALDRDVGVIERCLGADLTLAAGPEADLVCGAGQATEPDLGTVDALARLALTAHRHDRSVRLTGAPRALVDLLDLCGLAELLARLEGAAGTATAAGDSVEPGR
jgi:hypothetical protein